MNDREIELNNRLASALRRIAELEKIVKAVAYIGVDFGYGEYQLEQKHIENARELIKEKAHE